MPLDVQFSIFFPIQKLFLCHFLNHTVLEKVLIANIIKANTDQRIRTLFITIKQK